MVPVVRRPEKLEGKEFDCDIFDGLRHGEIVKVQLKHVDFEPIKVDLKQQSMLIEGVVVGVIRRGKGIGL